MHDECPLVLLFAWRTEPCCGSDVIVVLRPGGGPFFSKTSNFFPFSCCLKRFCRVCLSHRGLRGRVSESTIARPREKALVAAQPLEQPLARRSFVSHYWAPKCCTYCLRPFNDTRPQIFQLGSISGLCLSQIPAISHGTATDASHSAASSGGLFRRPPRCPPGSHRRPNESTRTSHSGRTGSVCLLANG